MDPLNINPTSPSANFQPTAQKAVSNLQNHQYSKLGDGDSPLSDLAEKTVNVHSNVLESTIQPDLESNALGEITTWDEPHDFDIQFNFSDFSSFLSDLSVVNNNINEDIEFKDENIQVKNENIEVKSDSIQTDQEIGVKLNEILSNKGNIAETINHARILEVKDGKVTVTLAKEASTDKIKAAVSEKRMAFVVDDRLCLDPSLTKSLFPNRDLRAGDKISIVDVNGKEKEYTVYLIDPSQVSKLKGYFEEYMKLLDELMRDDSPSPDQVKPKEKEKDRGDDDLINEKKLEALLTPPQHLNGKHPTKYVPTTGEVSQAQKERIHAEEEKQNIELNETLDEKQDLILQEAKGYLEEKETTKKAEEKIEVTKQAKSEEITPPLPSSQTSTNARLNDKEKMKEPERMTRHKRRKL